MTYGRIILCAICFGMLVSCAAPKQRAATTVALYPDPDAPPATGVLSKNDVFATALQGAPSGAVLQTDIFFDAPMGTVSIPAGMLLFKAENIDSQEIFCINDTLSSLALTFGQKISVCAFDRDP